LVYTASHDLKTPVINFQAMLKMLRSVKDKPDAGPMINNIIERMETATKRFHETIFGLLDVSRLKGLGDEMVLEPIALKALLEDTWDQIRAVADVQGAELHVGSLEPDTLYGNREALQSVFLNLFSNALKYADAQRPCRVQVSSTIQGASTTIRVQDNGIGIDLAAQGDKLFRMFTRLSSQAEGNGIGLYIVKRTLQKLGGDIRAESILREGTTFLIDFPISNVSTTI
jgi:signal transduction histidine kinase